MDLFWKKDKEFVRIKNYKTIRALIVAAPVNETVIVEQVPAPGATGTVLCCTPPVTMFANTVKITTHVMPASREGCKTGFVGCSGVRVFPMRGIGFF